MSVTSGCPPGESHDSTETRVQRIVDFWNQVRVCDDLGVTNWGALELIERQVTECLNRAPPDIAEAESLTALAMLMIAGWEQS